ncbi:Serine-threonine/tyrosine-protein kinase, catalytic domain [Sesbania bispinosa]|nr:Serine-threonine/tyrosine-protein kinase, catalytic domain [Sesbania bispinosa]
MPYPDLSFVDVSSAVVRQNLRPEIPRCCPSALGNIMRKCWDANPNKRPEMDEVVRMLEAIDTTNGGGMIPEDQTTVYSSISQHPFLMEDMIIILAEIFSLLFYTNGVGGTQSQTSVMETIPWGCDIDSLENASALQRWLLESGLPLQKMAIDKVDVGERGLVSLKNIRKGEKVLLVPPSLVVTADSVRPFFLLPLPLPYFP